jgi:hypothetical protein
MVTIHSKQHKEIVGSINNVPYVISFDADGLAEVEDSIATQLTSGRYGVEIIDEDGAIVNKVPTESKVIDVDPVVESDPLSPVKEEKATKTSKKSEGSDS